MDERRSEGARARRASRPARPMPCEQPPGLPEELPDDPAALKAIIADLELSNAALREVLAVLKAGAPALTNAEAAGWASRLEGAFGAAAACAALGLARSTYYYQLDALTSPSAPPDGTAGEVERAFRVDGNSSRGYRFVREVVSRRRGRPVSEKVVRRLMRGLGLRVCYARRGRYSSYAGEIDAPAPNLLLRADGTHDFSAGRPNEAWVSDVTEFRLPDDARKVYLSPVVDLFDGKPVGWAVGTSPDARLTEAITWLNAGYTCGAAFGPTVAGALIDTFGTMASFKVGTLLCLGMPITAILCYRVVKASILPAYTVVEKREM